MVPIADMPPALLAALIVSALAAATLLAAAGLGQLGGALRLAGRARRLRGGRRAGRGEGAVRLERAAPPRGRLVKLAAALGLAAPGGAAVSRRRLALFALGAVLAALLLARAGAALPLAFPAGLGVAAGLARLLSRREAARRARAFEQQVPDLLGLLVRCVRAGLPAAEAVAEAAREMPAPAGPLMAEADRQMRLGRGLEEALWDVAAAVRLAEFDFLCVAVSIQRETGGNLAETLAELETTVRKRLALRLKVRALSSEARASALIIGALPLVMAAALALVAPSYLAPLFATEPGRLLLAAAAASLGFGAFVMARLVAAQDAAR